MIGVMVQCSRVCFAAFPDMWASSLGVNILLSATPPPTSSSGVATALLWISSISKPSCTHHLCSEWLVLRRFIPLFPWLKVKARAQETLWIQYHTAHMHTNKQPNWQNVYKKWGRLVHREVSLFDILLFGSTGTISELSRLLSVHQSCALF